MFKNVDIAEVFNIRNFTHGGWYDKSNTKRKDLSKIYTAEMAARQVVQKVFGLGDKDIFEEDEQKYLEDIRNLILCIWVL